MKRRDFLKVCAAGTATLPAGESLALSRPRPEPAMQVILWCWDARMSWDDQPEAITRSMANPAKPFPYPKRPEAYLTGFKRLVDYLAEIGIWGVIIWGFLRDTHGGVQAAKELSRYAADCGVAIIPGVGLCSYGGYYFEGEHPFNLNTYLKKHPERVSWAVNHRGEVTTPVLDPSLPENRRWWRDGLEWMLENFELGGINFEMGDFIVNHSLRAKAARASLGFDADANIQDIVVATKELIRFGQNALPEALFINATYRGYHQIKNFPRMPFVNALPQAAVWEHTLTGMVEQPGFPDGFLGTPEHRKYGYLHWFNASTKSTGRDYVPEIARVFHGAHKLQFEFIGTYGEVSAIGNPLADRNYRAQSAWAENPELSLEDF